MAGSCLVLQLLLEYSFFSLAQSEPEPLQVPTSSRVYGPDGPWQAVSVQLGDPGQYLDLYPGSIFRSNILTVQQCQDINANPCGSGGLFDPENSLTFDNTSIRFTSPIGDSGTSVQWTYSAMWFSFSNLTPIRDQLQIQGQIVANLSAEIFSDITMVYPDGNYPLQVGELALGPTVNQSFSESEAPSINASLIPGYLAAQNIIPSNSFGLHVGIGAEELKLELSLWLGGYDAFRIVGPVSTQSIQDGVGIVVDLLDIGIGVDHGGSPFSYSSQEGLLSSGNSSISSAGIPVIMNPSSPYLNLPNSTCAAIAKSLPVTYNAGKALYFWNITNPQYAKIVTSPTFLSFVFRNSSGGSLTIKAPFQLFNLTLQAPLASTPTPYFPCQPPQAPGGSYSLGRAFLQAAFIGSNWKDQGEGEGEGYLAQAPGPNTETTPQIQPITNSPPVGLTSNWADTWTGFWTALPNTTTPALSTSTTPALPTSTSLTAPEITSTLKTEVLSGGAIAGVVIGGVCAALIAIGIGILLFRRKRGGKPEAVQPTIELKNAPKVSLHQPPRHWPSTEELIPELP